MKVSKTNKLPRIAAISIVAVTGVIIGIFLLIKNGNSSQPQTITGNITAISNQCHVDGVCSVTVDNTKTIVTGCGLRPDGTTCRVYDQSKLRAGQRVEATVLQTGTAAYSLECETCTIRVAL